MNPEQIFPRIPDRIELALKLDVQPLVAPVFNAGVGVGLLVAGVAFAVLVALFTLRRHK